MKIKISKTSRLTNYYSVNKWSINNSKIGQGLPTRRFCTQLAYDSYIYSYDPSQWFAYRISNNVSFAQRAVRYRPLIQVTAPRLSRQRNRSVKLASKTDVDIVCDGPNAPYQWSNGHPLSHCTHVLLDRKMSFYLLTIMNITLRLFVPPTIYIAVETSIYRLNIRRLVSGFNQSINQCFIQWICLTV